MTARGDNIRLLGGLMDDKARRQVVVNTYWATCKSVNWSEKTMEAEGVTDGAAFFGVQLGVGSCYQRPQVGALCLVGVIENQPTQTFLIAPDALDGIDVTVKDVRIESDGAKLSVSNGSENLKDLFDSLFDSIGRMVFTTNMGPTVNLVNKMEFEQLKTKFNNLLK